MERTIDEVRFMWAEGGAGYNPRREGEHDEESARDGWHEDVDIRPPGTTLDWSERGEHPKKCEWDGASESKTQAAEEDCVLRVGRRQCGGDANDPAGDRERRQSEAAIDRRASIVEDNEQRKGHERRT